MERLIDRLPDDVERLAHTLLDQACDRGLSLATAESCTGGLIAAILTDVEGTSHAFERGFVVYTIEAKAGLLGIPRSLIDTHGVVSREIAPVRPGPERKPDLCISVPCGAADSPFIAKPISATAAAERSGLSPCGSALP